MEKHNAIQYLILSVLLAAGAVFLPTETCYDSGLGQICNEYTYLGLSGQTTKILLGIVAAVLIALSVYIFSRTKGDPITAKSRARLRLAASTWLSPSDTLASVRQAAGDVKKGSGVNLMNFNLLNNSAQMNIERELPDRLALSIASYNRGVELCTFSVYVAGPGPDGKTRLHVGGLETYKTTQQRLFMIIPTGPKSIWGYPLYKYFLEVVASTVSKRDPSAQISIETPPAI